MEKDQDHSCKHHFVQGWHHSGESKSEKLVFLIVCVEQRCEMVILRRFVEYSHMYFVCVCGPGNFLDIFLVIYSLYGIKIIMSMECCVCLCFLVNQLIYKTACGPSG